MVILLVGDKSLLLTKKLNEYTSQVIDEKDEFNYQVFDMEETPIDEIIDNFNMPSFTSLKKVVVLKNPYFIDNEKQKLPFNNDLELFKDYLNNQNPDCEVIILCSKARYNPKSKYITLIKNAGGKVEELLLDDRNEFATYANALLKQLNVNIERKAFDILIDRCLGDVCKLEREIVKLSTYGDLITTDVAAAMVPVPLEDDVFELTNALLMKDRSKIMRIYNDLKLLKIEPINLIALLETQFRLIMEVYILKNKGLDDDTIASTLGVHPYRVKVTRKYQMHYSLNDVKDTLVSLSELDINIKNGVADRYVDFELFLATK